MTTLTLRLPDEVMRRLLKEAELEQRPRSEVVRVALARYLEQRERERLVAALARSARASATKEAEAVAETAIPAAAEALAGEEGPSGGTAGNDVPWWS